jgi:hypothetical protein
MTSWLRRYLLGERPEQRPPLSFPHKDDCPEPDRATYSRKTVGLYDAFTCNACGAVVSMVDERRERRPGWHNAG